MESVTAQWVEERLEELLLMDDKARERIKDVEKIIEKYKNDFKVQELELHRISSHQAQTMVDLSDMVKSLDRWLTLVLKVGIGMTVVVVIAILGFMWWNNHVNDLLYKAQSEEAAAMSLYRNLPTVIQKENGNVYVRILPGTERKITAAEGGADGATYALVYAGNVNNTQNTTDTQE